MLPDTGPGRARVALFVVLYLATVTAATFAGEELAMGLWPRLAGLMGVEPWPGTTMPEGMGGLVGGNPGLFVLRGLVTLGLVLAVTALFQWGLWRGRRRLAHLGLAGHRAGWELGKGFLIGAAAMLLVYLLLLAAGWATRLQPAAPSRAASGGTLLGLTLGLTFLAAQEELVARGFLLQSLAHAWGFPAATGVQAAAFALLHLANPHAGLASTAGIFAAGLFLAAGYARTGRLWLPTGAHTAWNLTEGVVLGFPLSGLATPSLLQARLTGPAAATGGAFGPEAGWIASAVLVVFTFWLGWEAWLGRDPTRPRGPGGDL
ncbi:CPBP family intramembrane glutamic endopeptidase [Limnochorda pilosa]|uniref:CAAX prenyl protease 2/Lysostaphin resistance protein A-like domain-containing protein n=1 Tax=Limnochorda pilosa TaxID=1555112 RepID=A0A0K2SKX9_LIMPI|nr:type II CAAX endopeptidase family protein [Limnochorda pilosa]BAS27768.1 hypothetical protein LIP_1927 [Limnochorda pilosa]